MAMVFGAFELNVSLLFLGNGVYSIMKNQQAQAIGYQNFSKQYLALEQYYDISSIYVDRESLEIREVHPENLLIPAILLDHGQINELLHEQDFIIGN